MSKFEMLCSLLPADVNWGDSITPDVVEQIAMAEREACAKVCEAHARGWEMNPGNNPAAGFIASSNCASDIRARSNAGGNATERSEGRVDHNVGRLTPGEKRL